MPESTQARPGILASASRYWRDIASRYGPLRATRGVLTAIWEFLRDSSPSRLRRRFGDAEYDWEYRVNTTSGAVGWRDRLLGNFYSEYQPTEPGLFQEMLDAFQQYARLDLAELTFVDLGSGKGRTLLMASNYPFRKILGVELLPSLNQIARQNLVQYKSESQKCFDLNSICADATTFPLPEGPLLVYLFNPFPEAPLGDAVRNIEAALRENRRPIYVLYHNPVLEPVVADSRVLRKITGTHQFSIFEASH